MKFRFRKPSWRKRLAARASFKRLIRHSLGLKAPRGYGWLTNPKRAAYNRIYNRTRIDLVSILAKNPKASFVLIALSALGLFAFVFIGILLSLFIPSPTISSQPTTNANSAINSYLAAPTARTIYESTSTPIILPTNLNSAINADSIHVAMVLIPKGNFLMGKNNATLDESPKHLVNLDEFYIDKYEVTNSLYSACPL